MNSELTTALNWFNSLTEDFKTLLCYTVGASPETIGNDKIILLHRLELKKRL